MNITAIKTEKIRSGDTTIAEILEKYISIVQDHSVIIITSKIVSLCEGRVAEKNTASKSELASQEADLYLPPTKSKYDITLTIKNNTLIPSAGIDESNGDGKY